MTIVSICSRASDQKTDGALPYPRLLAADRRGGVQAQTLPEIIEEMLVSTTSERQGRVIDRDQAGSMELKKRQGYF
jgi:3'-phosphoadenosine 5'-phosphosulfate sulfotransferase (PAPS reductase)/FAD synthetase